MYPKLIFYSDSIEGLFDTFKQCALISKESGGIGVSYQGVRGNGSYIRGINGTSHGSISYLRILNDVCRAVDQGGKRKGAFAVFQAPWLVDIFDFLNLKMAGGDENMSLDNIIDQNHFPNTGNNLFDFIYPKEVIDSEDPGVLRDALLNVKKYINYINRAERSSKKHRNVGLGDNGLADTLVELNIAYDSDEAVEFVRELAEARYYAAVKQSVKMAKERGKYESYEGSPASKSLLSYHMHGVTPKSKWDWKTLKEDQLKYGMRNSLLIAPMPTRATSHILGNSECFEPPYSMMYKVRILAGDFIVFYRLLVRRLKKEGLWNKDIRDKIMLNRGSVMEIEKIPIHIRNLFKNPFQIKMRRIIDMAAESGYFID